MAQMIATPRYLLLNLNEFFFDVPVAGKLIYFKGIPNPVVKYENRSSNARSMGGSTGIQYVIERNHRRR
jgi:hypothetical protein